MIEKRTRIGSTREIVLSTAVPRPWPTKSPTLAFEIPISPASGAVIREYDRLISASAFEAFAACTSARADSSFATAASRSRLLTALISASGR